MPRGRFLACTPRLLGIPMVGQLLDVVHQAVQAPLRIDFRLAAQPKAVQTLLVSQVAKHWSDVANALAIQVSASWPLHQLDSEIALASNRLAGSGRRGAARCGCPPACGLLLDASARSTPSPRSCGRAGDSTKATSTVRRGAIQPAALGSDKTLAFDLY